MQAGSPVSLISENCFPFLTLFKGRCFGAGVQICHPSASSRPQRPLGGGSREMAAATCLWVGLGTPAAGAGEPGDNRWHFGDI